MKILDSNIPCPSCRGPLAPVALRCEACDLRVEGRFATNEFASLAPEHLHTLRIFVHCDGRIRDMEKALGVSYPTVKSLLAQLKKALGLPDPAALDEVPTSSGAAAPSPPTPPSAPPPSETPRRPNPKPEPADAEPAMDPLAVLAAIERGELTPEEAAARLRGAKPKRTKRPPT